MIYTLKNDIITAKISDKGAEIVSVIRNEDCCEYIWQGDTKYWSGQAPYLFPICGRLNGKKYTYGGKEYSMEQHGFARRSVFSLVSLSPSSISFSLSGNAETQKVYPFDFKLTITHTLIRDTIATDVTIENTGEVILPATFGAHPGFNVPLGNAGSFDDYILEFSEECSPDEIVCSDEGLNTGIKRAFELNDGKYIKLCHSLFDNDSIFMDGVPDTVTLRSELTQRGVTVRYPKLPYLGIWHAPRSDAPYMCIEPWYGLPSYQGKTDDLATKNNMYRIIPGSEKKIHMEITFH